MNTKSIKISTISIRQIRIPLNFQFAQSNNSGSTRSNSMIVTLHNDENLTGYGEACPRKYVTGEDYQSMVTDLGRVKELLFSESVESYDHFCEILKNMDIGPSTQCALEMAWLDLFSKEIKKTIPEILGVKLPSFLRYSLVFPLLSAIALQKLCEKVKMFSPPSIKLKVDGNIEEHLKKLPIIRSYFGNDIPIRFDINGGWTLEDAQGMIPRYLNKNVRSFEQPLDPKDMIGSQQLTNTFGNEAFIMGDESLLSKADAEQILEQSIFNHLNIKVSKLGGLNRAKTICKMAESYEVPCQLGAHFGETSLLTAAGMYLAASVSGFSQYEGALGILLLSEDILNKCIQQDLEGKVFTKDHNHALGFVENINQQSLEKYATNIETWTVN